MCESKMYPSMMSPSEQHKPAHGGYPTPPSGYASHHNSTRERARLAAIALVEQRERERQQRIARMARERTSDWSHHTPR